MARTHNTYLQIVFNFMAANGPFKLDVINYTDSDQVNCGCCGKRAIHNLYHISNQAGKEFIVGSECQEWLLETTDAHLPASKVRTLDVAQLERLAVKYGITMMPTTQDGQVDREELVGQVIKARRSFANKAGWVSRKASAPVAEQLSLPEGN